MKCAVCIDDYKKYADPATECRHSLCPKRCRKPGETAVKEIEITRTVTYPGYFKQTDLDEDGVRRAIEQAAKQDLIGHGYDTSDLECEVVLSHPVVAIVKCTWGKV